jgi:hypothetical protein
VRSHECERGTQECVRHNCAPVTISLRQATSANDFRQPRASSIFLIFTGSSIVTKRDLGPIGAARKTAMFGAQTVDFSESAWGWHNPIDVDGLRT